MVRGSVEETLNELLEKEAESLTQAARYERSEARQGYRSGHYDRNLTTTSGDVTLHMPRLKGVSFEAAIIERYRRWESSKGRKPGYSARRGEAAYKANKKRSRKPHRVCHCTRFIRWIMEQVKEHKWSLDACVGYARLHGLFSAEEMVCTHTLYNEVWAGSLDLSVTELPEAMKRKQHKDSKLREHKKNFGTDISQRAEIASLRIEEGHWEGDTVVGKRAGKEAVVLSLLEKKTENYIAIRIPGKDANSVLNAMQSLKEEFGDKFSQVFKTITVDNGSEFSAFSQVENWGCAVYFAHPYTSWERPQNERHNGLFRTFVPKGVSIEAFSAEYILAAADELNGRPRKKLGYRTPEELFDEFLDSVYAAEGCGNIAQDGSQRLPSWATL